MTRYVGTWWFQCFVLACLVWMILLMCVLLIYAYMLRSPAMA